MTVSPFITVDCDTGHMRHPIESIRPRDLLLQAAMAEEINPIVDVLSNPEVVNIGPWRFWLGNVGAASVALSRTDEGPLNAAASSALGIYMFSPRAVINFGIAGAHNPELRKGDLVIVRHSVDYSGLRTAAACEGEGIDCERWRPKPHKIRTSADAVTPFLRFASDSSLVELASGIVYDLGRVFVGTAGTALQVDAEVDRIRWLRRTYETDTADQETAYSAGVATALSIPFVGLRVVSDSVFDDPVIDKRFGRHAAMSAISLVEAVAQTDLLTRKR